MREPDEGGAVRYRAIAGEQQSVGNTAGEALDAISAQLPADKKGTLVVVQNLQADQFFTKEQRTRLDDLMTRWRAARDAGAALSAIEQAELDHLVQEEVVAAGRRAAALSDELDQ
ncbi:MAG TPA: hypothetical protein VNH11_29875 [Pirellulales bacterium]|nr:hypothetical protein [Pirellulales bacterium]